MNEEVYLSRAVFEYLKPQELTIQDVSEVEEDGLKKKYVFLLFNDIRLKKRVNKGDETTLLLLKAKHGDYKNRKVRIEKTRIRNQEALVLVPAE